jgi:hypothetical protein
MNKMIANIQFNSLIQIKMKTLRFNSLTKRILLGTLAILLILSFDLQAKKVSFLTSSVVPAARGNAKINKNSNNNYVVKLQISGLAEVERLQPSKQTYIVWMVTDQEMIKNMGQMKSSSGFLSKKLTAKFETASSFKPVKIFITAENDPGSQYPEGENVLTTDRF